MRIKLFIGTGVSVILIASLITYLFYNKLEEFEETIRNDESKQLETFQQEKKDLIAKLTNEGLIDYFDKYYNNSIGITTKDTSFAFLFFDANVQYKYGHLDYLECLHQKCINEKINDSINIQIELKEDELLNKFGSTFSTWYPKCKDGNLIRKIYSTQGCSKFIYDLHELAIDEPAWEEFEDFLATYDSEIALAESQSLQADMDFNNSVTTTRLNLATSVIDFFDDKLALKKSSILKTTTESRIYEAPALGTISYSITKKTFNSTDFDLVADAAYEEQWKYNSLSNGSKPYAACFGSYNSCSDWGCSQIKVITGGNIDVLVTIKNNNGSVVRHAYIKGGYSYTFDVKDGRYQVFFYSGKGWNPNKKMTSSSCNNLIGGFVTMEDVSKDSYIDLYSQIMTYELILQEDGNFSTKPSSKNEAF